MNDNQDATLKEEEILEQIFHLIQLGNDAASEPSLSYWKAAEHYIHACELLQEQLVGVVPLVQAHQSSKGNQPLRNENDEKFQQLYHEQINYYYQKTRSCIVKALQQQQQQEEGEQQEVQSSNVTKINTINTITSVYTNVKQDEHQYQFHILQRFYSFLYPVTVPSSTNVTATNTTNTGHDINDHRSHDTKTKKTDGDQAVEENDDTTTTLQLEQRLRQLNATLPTHMKSDAEILRERNEQLRRIGVPVGSTSIATTSLDHIHTTTHVQQLLESIRTHHYQYSSVVDDPIGVDDDDDSVEAIIAQVTEEVRLLQPPIEAIEKEIMDLKSDIDGDLIKTILEKEKNADNGNNDDEEEEEYDDDDDDMNEIQ